MKKEQMRSDGGKKGQNEKCFWFPYTKNLDGLTLQTEWLTEWLTDWLTDWVPEWTTDYLMWCTNSPTPFNSHIMKAWLSVSETSKPLSFSYKDTTEKAALFVHQQPNFIYTEHILMFMSVHSISSQAIGTCQRENYRYHSHTSQRLCCTPKSHIIRPHQKFFQFTVVHCLIYWICLIFTHREPLLTPPSHSV